MVNTNKKQNAEKNTALNIAVACLFVFVAASVYVKVWDTDIWWHLKSGQIISETAKLPATDLFSFTKDGQKWINDEWMGDSYLYGAYRKWGFAGLQGLSVACAVLIVLIIYSMAIGLGAEPLVVIPLAVAAVLASRVRLTCTRPEIFSILFSVILFFLLNRTLREGEKEAASGETVKHSALANPIFFIPVLQVFWANIHPSATFGLLLIFAAIVAAAVAFIADTKFGLEIKPKISSLTMRRLGVAFIVSIAVTAVNPYGLHALSAPLKFARAGAFVSGIVEWAPIPLKQYFSIGGEPGSTGLPAFLILGAAAFAFNRKKIDIFHLLVFLITAYMALRARRFIAVFCLLSAPSIAHCLTPAFKDIFEQKRSYIAAVAAVVIALAAAFNFLVFKNQKLPWGGGVAPDRYPEAAIRFVKSAPLEGEMFNDYSIGGALIWGLSPDRKVFIDGRTTLYGRNFYKTDYDFHARPSLAKWNAIVKKYKLNFAVIGTGSVAVFKTIRDGAGWRVVFWDNRTIVLANPVPGNEKVIADNGYSLVDPYNAIEAALNWKKLQPENRLAVEKELDRSLAESPRNITAIRALAFIKYYEGKRADALKLAKRGIAIDPGIAGLHAVAGEIMLSQGNRKSALSEFRKAAAIMPEYGKIVTQLKSEGGK